MIERLNLIQHLKHLFKVRRRSEGIPPNTETAEPPQVLENPHGLFLSDFVLVQVKNLEIAQMEQTLQRPVGDVVLTQVQKLEIGQNGEIKQRLQSTPDYNHHIEKLTSFEQFFEFLGNLVQVFAVES